MLNKLLYLISNKLGNDDTLLYYVPNPKQNNELRSCFKDLINKKNLIGVEVGCSGGKNAKQILDNLDIKMLYLIDVRDVLELDGYTNYTFLHTTSHDAVSRIPNNLDFTYIDGNHCALLRHFIEQNLLLFLLRCFPQSSHLYSICSRANNLYAPTIYINCGKEWRSEVAHEQLLLSPFLSILYPLLYTNIFQL